MGEVLNESSPNRQDGALLDIMASSCWGRQHEEKTSFDVRE